MIELVLATLDLAATQFVLYSPWVKSGPVDNNHILTKGTPYMHWYIYDLQHEFLEVEDSSKKWVAFYMFIIITFVTSVLGFVGHLFVSFGSLQYLKLHQFINTITYLVQSISIIISGLLFHNTISEWVDTKPELTDNTSGIKHWQTWVAPAVLWIVFIHSVLLTLMNYYQASTK